MCKGELAVWGAQSSELAALGLAEEHRVSKAAGWGALTGKLIGLGLAGECRIFVQPAYLQLSSGAAGVEVRVELNSGLAHLPLGRAVAELHREALGKA